MMCVSEVLYAFAAFEESWNDSIYPQIAQKVERTFMNGAGDTSEPSFGASEVVHVEEERPRHYELAHE